jgi:hypothetical protein
MAEAYYYVDDAGRQQGPVGVDEIDGLVRHGTVRAETLAWTAGMSDWARADSISAFAPAFARSPPPISARAGTAAAAPDGALTGAFPAWGLFWRAIVFGLGIVLIVPAPWAGVWFYKWVAGNVVLPGGRPLRLQSGVGEAWWLFAGFGVSQGVATALNIALDVQWGGLISAILGFVLGWAQIRWFCAHVGTDDGSTKIAFVGGVAGYLGWGVLVAASSVTVIGWAWGLKYWLRWICRNVEGAPSFAFNGGGWAILWRTLLLGCGSVLVIPIPWLLKWYANWMISQFSTVAAGRS